MKIAVLGAGGFIGCNLVTYLKDRNHHVRAVDIEYPEYRKPAFSRADEIMQLDLREERAASDAVNGMDWVVQLAANMGGVGFFHGGHDYYPYLDNQRININVMRAIEAQGIERMFFSASACVYPTHLNDTVESPILTEDMIYPANCDMSYGWEKLMTLRMCERAPFDARVGIFDTIYGVYQEHEGERMKFPTSIATKVLKASQDDKPIEIWGDGTQQRVFLYIEDALEKIYRILTTDSYNGPVNVCSEQLVTIQGIADMCCEIVGITPGFKHDLTKPVGVLSRKSSGQKFDIEYGKIAEHTPREGFTKLINWLRPHILG